LVKKALNLVVSGESDKYRQTGDYFWALAERGGLKCSQFPGCICLTPRLYYYCTVTRPAKFPFKHLRLPFITKRIERQRLREVVQNILNEPIPEKVKQRLLKPLRPSKGGKPIAPPRRKQETRSKALLEEFDPYLPLGNQTITNYKNELLRLYDALEGVEEGRRFMRLIFSRRLGKNVLL